MARDENIYKKVCLEYGHDYILRDASDVRDESSSFMCRKCGGIPEEHAPELDED